MGTNDVLQMPYLLRRILIVACKKGVLGNRLTLRIRALVEPSRRFAAVVLTGEGIDTDLGRAVIASWWY